MNKIKGDQEDKLIKRWEPIFRIKGNIWSKWKNQERTAGID